MFSADVRYTDPLVDVRGAEALAATIGAVQAQFPGFVFRLLGPVDAHHDQLRFTWELGPEGGRRRSSAPTSPCVDADGRISTVLGFLDRVPARRDSASALTARVGPCPPPRGRTATIGP